MPSHEQALLSLIQRHIDWEGWERLAEANGITVDRPKGSPHPKYPEIIYPIDYGYVSGTLGTEGDELDIFLGSGSGGLVAAIFTTDYRRGDRECKLLYNCTREEIYLVNGFINFNRFLMEGELVMRRPMRELS